LDRENLKKPISIIGKDDPENATSSQKIEFLKNGAELLSISGKGTNLWNTQSSELITNYNFIPSESLDLLVRMKNIPSFQKTIDYFSSIIQKLAQKRRNYSPLQVSQVGKLIQSLQARTVAS
jgi:hypothetical protein